ncbi:beta-propeller domain-containing protein [Candidatus Woesearchaeota archaeon]|nr:beta-propeller domain-containing protein [Candidatus Woesearchaeota archaeon]
MKKNIITILLITTLLITACQTTTDYKNEFDPENTIKTTTFSTTKEYQEFITQNTNQNSYYGLLTGAFRSATNTAEIAIEDTAMKLGAATQTTDYSQTNVQVQGIDEGDIIKTDGEYIYTITDKTLFIINAYPGEDAEIISTIKLKNTPTGLFIEKNKLAIFGNVDYNNIYDEAKIRINNGMTYLEIYDITDKITPELKKTYKFEGNYLESRMINNKIYLMTNTNPENRIITPMPIIIEDNTITQIEPKNIEYFNINYQNPRLIGIHQINTENNELDESKMITVEGQPTTYMSNNNIYLAHTEYISEWELRQEILQKVMEPEMPEHYKTLIQKIREVDTDILNSAEKTQKISQLYNEYLYALQEEKREEIQEQTEQKLKEKLKELKYLEYTIINKVNVENNIQLQSNTRIPGTLNNQFAMDEHKEILRVATTTRERYTQETKQEQTTNNERLDIMPMPPIWNQNTKNNVYTLNQDLELLGSIEGLAQGETIYSTRFIQDKLYMVTFRQVDPFFVIDLSDPKNPENLGELKIPGFSRYLHPYDENTIIGIGRDATETGRQQGIKISLFDVTDVTEPKEVAKYVSDQKYSSTSAEWEHKAFLFNKEKELLVIPAFNYNYQDQDENYNGALVFKITKDEVELRGLIDHSEGTNNRWSPSVERSLYIEDELYTKSPYLLRINNLETLKGIKNIELTTENTPNIPTY